MKDSSKDFRPRERGPPLESPHPKRKRVGDWGGDGFLSRRLPVVCTECGTCTAEPHALLFFLPVAYERRWKMKWMRIIRLPKSCSKALPVAIILVYGLTSDSLDTSSAAPCRCGCRDGVIVGCVFPGEVVKFAPDPGCMHLLDRVSNGKICEGEGVVHFVWGESEDPCGCFHDGYYDQPSFYMGGAIWDTEQQEDQYGSCEHVGGQEPVCGSE